MKKYHVVDAKIEDMQDIFAVFKASIDTICKDCYSEKQRTAWKKSVTNEERWKQRIQKDYFITIRDRNNLLGFGSLQENYIDLLYVHPLYVRNGIASRIFKILKDHVLLNEYKTIKTNASFAALPFFKAKGFSVIKEQHVHINGEELTNFEMIIKLKNE